MIMAPMELGLFKLEIRQAEAMGKLEKALNNNKLSEEISKVFIKKLSVKNLVYRLIGINEWPSDETIYKLRRKVEKVSGEAVEIYDELVYVSRVMKEKNEGKI